MSAVPSVVDARDATHAPRRPRWSSWRRNRAVRAILSYPPALIAACILLIVLLGAVLGPLLLPFDPNNTSLADALLAPGTAGHLFGTDEVGRDVFVRVLAGARVSLIVGLVGASSTAIIGCLVGLVAGWFRGTLGAVLMRLVDLQIAFPFLLFAITVASVVGSGLGILLALFSLWFWGPYARVAEGLTISLAKREFVESAKTIGATTPRILLRHVLPQLLSPVLVLWSFSFATLIIAEASLSFLGLGIPPPTATWGSMLAEGRSNLNTAWWLAIFPGIAISITVWSINILGDRLRDILDRRIQV